MNSTLRRTVLGAALLAACAVSAPVPAAQAVTKCTDIGNGQLCMLANAGNPATASYRKDAGGEVTVRLGFQVRGSSSVHWDEGFFKAYVRAEPWYYTWRDNGVSKGVAYRAVLHQYGGNTWYSAWATP
ncbi:hypothetical protein GCM10009850_031300 [Nonomuraea monospora]|uniref:Uncharacterized protein n=1 Tax=Nonomuraea monospora TaxID=568818 RepID=A0ABP5PAZ3_9ACTN